MILAWDPELQSHRALKIPHQHLIESGKVNADSYIAEARKMALLGRHPGIVTVLDVQRMGNGTPFVVSEFVEGGSLAGPPEYGTHVLARGRGVRRASGGRGRPRT